MLSQDRSELWHLPARAGGAQQVQLNPGLEANGSSCTHTCAKVYVNQSVAVRLWVLGLVPVWVKDAQMLSLGKATGKDQGLPQYGIKLLFQHLSHDPVEVRLLFLLWGQFCQKTSVVSR